MHALRQQHAQQRLAETDAALHAGERGDEQAFEGHEPEHLRVVGRSAGLVGGERGDDGVDDELAEIGDAGRHDARRERQHAEGHGQRSVRRPDERDGSAAIAPEAEIAVERLAPGAFLADRGRQAAGGAYP